MNSTLEYHVVNLLKADPGFPLREFKKKKKTKSASNFISKSFKINI